MWSVEQRNEDSDVPGQLITTNQVNTNWLGRITDDASYCWTVTSFEV